MNNDLLIELGSEDLPARYVKPLAEALSAAVTTGLATHAVGIDSWNTFATPRRLAVLVKGVALVQGDQKIERSGPSLAAAFKNGQPTEAALGFARSCGVELAVLGQKDGKLHFSIIIPGRKTVDLVPEIFDEALKRMDELVPKRMRWGAGDEIFVRPVQWIVALLGSKVVPISRFGLKSSNKTYGHRFHAPMAIALKSPAEYEKKLKSARVWADPVSRKAEIRKQLERIAAKLKGAARITESLLDEVTALVEWPVAIHGTMEQRFMRLPPEVIIATIEHNQRYFPVFGKNQKLLPFFITVTNIQSRDVRQVIAGNERVVTPRLSDALFFLEQDLKQAFAGYSHKLGSVTYQKDLGSLLSKVQRMGELSDHITAALQQSDSDATLDGRAARRATDLCKNDLVTRMVYEFPDLQGVMGAYYAASSGESAVVVQAIREHYLPTQHGTPIPASAEGRIVALADKLDTLAGIFSVGLKPSASKDPFALRRAALGVLRICIEGKLPLDVKRLLQAALEMQPTGKKDATRFAELWDFVLERLRSLLTEQGVPIEVFNAVAATGVGAPADFVARVAAVRAFVAMPESAQLAAAHKRVRNILRDAKDQAAKHCDPAKLEEESERRLHAQTLRLQDEIQELITRRNYMSSMKRLATIQPAVDEFFNGTMVMAEDLELRANRLALLKDLDAICRSVADISCLPG